MTMRTAIGGLALVGLCLCGCVPPASNVATQAATPPPAEPAPPVAAEPAPAPVPGANVPGVYTSGEQRWFKDQYGRCYRINAQGDRVYDATAGC